MVVKKHHDHGSSLKGKRLIGDDLQFKRFIPLSSWQHADRHLKMLNTGHRLSMREACPHRNTRPLKRSHLLL